jgi:hypothetical protein
MFLLCLGSFDNIHLSGFKSFEKKYYFSGFSKRSSCPVVFSATSPVDEAGQTVSFGEESRQRLGISVQ